MGNKELYQMSNARNFKPVLGIAIFIVLGTLILTWGNAKAQAASEITVATGTPQPAGSRPSVPAVRVGPNASNASATNPNQGAVTQLVGANPPVYLVSANCTLDAQGSFSITNTGGLMIGSGTWVLTQNGTTLASNPFFLDPGASFTGLNTSGLYGALELSVSGGGGQPASAVTICPYPTATPTSTVTNTPVPPSYLVNANCTADAYGTFSITNTGGPMIGNGTWVLTQDGTTMATNPFSLAPG
jgi:hypothetical protein